MISWVKHSFSEEDVIFREVTARDVILDKIGKLNILPSAKGSSQGNDDDERKSRLRKQLLRKLRREAEELTEKEAELFEIEELNRVAAEKRASIAKMRKATERSGGAFVKRTARKMGSVLTSKGLWDNIKKIIGQLRTLLFG